MKISSLVACAATLAVFASALPVNDARADIIPIPGDCGPSSSYSIATVKGRLNLKQGSKLLPMTPIDDDEANPLYSADDGGNALTVEMWRGASDAELDLATQEDESLLESLAEASVTGATEVEAEFVETTEQVIPAASTASLVAFALSVESSGPGTVVQRSLLNEPTAENGTVVQSSSKCGSGPVTSSITLKDSVTGNSFDFPASSRVVSGTAKGVPTLPTIVKYKTFIPLATASAPICGTFRGDNRSWSSASNRNRTQVTLSAYFHQNRLTAATQIGTTYKVDGNNKILAKKTASKDGVKYTVKSKGSSYMNVQVNHAVKNPLCNLSGPIRYTHVVELYPRGGARISGTLNRVPSHEAYVYYNGKSKTILQLSHRGFSCLIVQAPWCGLPASVRSHASIS